MKNILFTIQILLISSFLFFGNACNSNGVKVRNNDEDNLPRGSYLENCKDCAIVGNNMQCLCYTLNNMWRWNTLLNVSTCTYVKNIYGSLICLQRTSPQK